MLGLGLGRFLSQNGRARVDATAAWSRELFASLGGNPSTLTRAKRLQRARRQLVHRSFNGDCVALVGFFRTNIGLSRAAHLLGRELAEEGANVHKVDATRALGHPETERDDECLDFAQLASLDLTDVVFHLNPPEFYNLVPRLCSASFLRPFFCTYVAWELSRAPPFWKFGLACMDEVWVPSRFVHDALLGLELALRVSDQDSATSDGARSLAKADPRGKVFRAGPRRARSGRLCGPDVPVCAVLPCAQKSDRRHHRVQAGLR